jgi:hypothetical protein
MTPLDQALELASQGFKVFFCKSDKTPTCVGGFHRASNDPWAVFELWSYHPGPLVAIVTGAASGLDVVDVDTKHLAAQLWLHLNQSRLPATRTHRTRSAGYHFFFQHRAAMRCSVSRIAIGIDVRSDGGYVIWWPYSEGEILNEASPAPWPDWLAELVGPSPLKFTAKPAPGGSKRQPLPKVGNSYGAKALQRAREIILRSGRGQQEHVIHRESFSIGSLVGAGILPEAVARSALIGIAGAVPSLDPARPWRPGEVERKMRRGFELGIAHPRAVTIRGSRYGE